MYRGQSLAYRFAYAAILLVLTLGIPATVVQMVMVGWGQRFMPTPQHFGVSDPNSPYYLEYMRRFHLYLATNSTNLVVSAFFALAALIRALSGKDELSREREGAQALCTLSFISAGVVVVSCIVALLVLWPEVVLVSLTCNIISVLLMAPVIASSSTERVKQADADWKSWAAEAGRRRKVLSASISMLLYSTLVGWLVILPLAIYVTCRTYTPGPEDFIMVVPPFIKATAILALPLLVSTLNLSVQSRHDRYETITVLLFLTGFITQGLVLPTFVAGLTERDDVFPFVLQFTAFLASLPALLGTLIISTINVVRFRGRLAVPEISLPVSEKQPSEKQPLLATAGISIVVSSGSIVVSEDQVQQVDKNAVDVMEVEVAEQVVVSEPPVNAQM